MQQKDYCDRNIIYRKPGGLTADSIKEFLNFKGLVDSELFP